MADVHSKETRSYNMSRIRSKNTKPEMLVRKFLFAHGFRYRLHDKKLPGKPDIVLPKYKTVIFVNGCFWHGHEGCKYFSFPKNNYKWWSDKINGNQKRDKISLEALKEMNWSVIIVWTCQLKNKKKEKRLIKLIEEISYI